MTMPTVTTVVDQARKRCADAAAARTTTHGQLEAIQRDLRNNDPAARHRAHADEPEAQKRWLLAVEEDERARDNYKRILRNDREARAEGFRPRRHHLLRDARRAANEFMKVLQQIDDLNAEIEAADCAELLW